MYSLPFVACILPLLIFALSPFTVVVFFFVMVFCFAPSLFFQIFDSPEMEGAMYDTMLTVTTFNINFCTFSFHGCWFLLCDGLLFCRLIVFFKCWIQQRWKVQCATRSSFFFRCSFFVLRSSFFAITMIRPKIEETF